MGGVGKRQVTKTWMWESCLLGHIGYWAQLAMLLGVRTKKRSFKMWPMMLLEWLSWIVLRSSLSLSLLLEYCNSLIGLLCLGVKNFFWWSMRLFKWVVALLVSKSCLSDELVHKHGMSFTCDLCALSFWHKFEAF